MSTSNIQNLRTNEYGNDIVSLINTYKNEILSIDRTKRSQVSSTQLSAILIAYPMALNINVFASFKDSNLGKLMLNEYQNEFEQLIESDSHTELIFQLAEIFKKQLTVDARNINQYCLDFYISLTNNKATNEELTWIKNYISAIHLIYINYNKAAEQYGFF
jgi:hypothetical protein